MKGFTDVDNLLNVKDETRRYTGLTDDLEARLKFHNQKEHPLSIQVPSLAN
jgi:predicted GIY-YIG superfamily endonuclease